MVSPDCFSIAHIDRVAPRLRMIAKAISKCLKARLTGPSNFMRKGISGLRKPGNFAY